MVLESSRFKIRGLAEDLVQPHRSLILEEALVMGKKTAPPSYFMLFSDILVAVEQPDADTETILDLRCNIAMQVTQQNHLDYSRSHEIV